MTAQIITIIETYPRKMLQPLSKLEIDVNCSYEISLNVNVADGLTNGARAIVKKVQLAGTNLEGKMSELSENNLHSDNLQQKLVTDVRMIL